MALWAVGGAHIQAGSGAACGIGTAPMRLKLPKASPVMIQSTASEAIAILVPVFIVCPPGFSGSDLVSAAAVPVRRTHHGLKLQICV
jgi:hypothetical protein